MGATFQAGERVRRTVKNLRPVDDNVGTVWTTTQSNSLQEFIHFGTRERVIVHWDSGRFELALVPVMLTPLDAVELLADLA